MAAPETQKTDQASKANAPASSGGAPAPGRPSAPKRGGGGILARLVLSAILLFVILGIAGYGALIFRDSDPRVGVAAGYVDQGVAEAQNAVGKARSMIADLTGSGAPKPAAEPEKPAATPVEPEPPQTTAAAPATPTPPAAPSWEMPPAKEPEKPVETKAAPAPEKPAEEAKPVESAKPMESPKPVEPVKSAEPVKAPEPVPAPAPVVAAPAAPLAPTEFRDADGFTAHDLIAALEGRIEALNEEVQTLRQKLDAPKNETRAAPETIDAQKAQSAPATAAPDVSGAEIALAFALQRDLDAGRPFTAEIEGFSKLGTSPAPGPALVQFAETGAPTAAKLHEEFQAVAKKLRANESHATGHDAGALADHILEGASKLVKVRPTTGAAEPESFHGKLDRIAHALAHSDFASADSLFESLPEAAREEAEAFGKSLRQRLEAAKAAEELLNSAIAALGKK